MSGQSLGHGAKAVAFAFFAKNERADLSDKERNAFVAFVKSLTKT